MNKINLLKDLGTTGTKISMEQLNEVSLIIPHLYITNWTSSADSKKLRENNIRAVLTIENEPRSKDTLSLYAEEEIDYIQKPLDDVPTADITQYFDSTYDFINKHVSKGENTIVNCFAGISRSVSIVLNYLIRRFYLRAREMNAIIEPEDAVKKSLDLIRKNRPAANPNPGFMKQLLARAAEYAKNSTKSGLNFISPMIKPIRMCEKSFVDASGKPANIICLGNADFDTQGNLINFKDVNGVIFFYSNGCGHCTNTKPEYIKFANMLSGSPIRAFSVDGAKERELLARINPMTWNYLIKGFPSIIGYSKGQFYSEYSPDPANPASFRKTEDFLQYAKGLGTAPVEII